MMNIHNRNLEREFDSANHSSLKLGTIQIWQSYNFPSCTWYALAPVNIRTLFSMETTSHESQSEQNIRPMEYLL